MDSKPVSRGVSQAPTAFVLPAPAKPSKDKTPWARKVWSHAKVGLHRKLCPQGAGYQKGPHSQKSSYEINPTRHTESTLAPGRKGNVLNLIRGRYKTK